MIPQRVIAQRLRLASTLLLLACSRPDAAAPALFESLSPESTGITFVNELPERPEFNILNYLYYFNGGGVAVGDVNNDGLPDLYFSSNLGSNRLYLNKGSYRFEDVTEQAGVAGPEGWKTGVTMADVNGDGWVDIYVSAVSYLAMQGRNVLYVNKGDGSFTDRTKAFGLEHVGYSTQAAFFDYDGDGDLDMYLLNHSTHTERGIDALQRGVLHSPAADVLFRNDGGRFVDVSDAAGVRDGVGGFGLGVVVSDLNADGCPDIYVANDFQEDDFLYVNNCDGTFKESLATATAHTSRFSMGVDAADFNNDGRPDVFVADMLPEREEILKTSASSEGFNLFDLRLRAGYQPQYPRNTLQLNRGGLKFSEIGYLAGVFATDWSWAPLFADLDNDGRKDLFITSGIFRRPNDLDYINYIGNEAVQAALADTTKDHSAVFKRMPQIPVANHAYRNDGDLRFTDMAAAWGLGRPGFSNGAAYVDLNNSGSLDLVVNTLGAPAAIYRNRAREVNGHGYLAVQLRGAGGNTAGFGAKVMVVAGDTRQLLEQMPTRGFQSSVDPTLHFGVGTLKVLDSVTVVWPDRRFQVLTQVAVNRTLTLSQDSASGRYVEGSPPGGPQRFTDVTTALGVNVRHEENDFLDYNREPLMPHLLSTEGPALAVGDMNGDGLDDLFVGGAKWQPGHLLFQRRNGTFAMARSAALTADSLAEDVDAALFDADGDGDLDLYVVSAGNEFWGNAEALRDRLYLNDGRGGFSRSAEGLPALFDNGSCVVPADFDGDGDLDLFVGSRVVAREYGRIPPSHLLRNDGTGRFTDVTQEVAPELLQAGMVSSAVWTDVDGDGVLDLVVAGEWMPVRVYRQHNGRFEDATSTSGLAKSDGWWNSVVAADVNRDGRPDLILGNLGLNSYLRAGAAEPARLYAHDFGNTGALKQVLTFYRHGVSYPLVGRDELVRLIPALRGSYPSYRAFGASRIEDIFSADELAAASLLEARTFASAVALNRGGGILALHPLPVEAQFAPVRASLADDLDGDGVVDLLLAGNFNGVPPVLGRYDASYGSFLRGLGDGRFDPVDMARSGLLIQGEVRNMKIVRGPNGGKLIAVARNGATLQLLRVNR
ncbi:MAG: VCBS repeat-containing protein [Gemmatimonadaceae bacterium]